MTFFESISAVLLREGCLVLLEDGIAEYTGTGHRGEFDVDRISSFSKEGT
jgi:hypothetical protein